MRGDPPEEGFWRAAMLGVGWLWTGLGGLCSGTSLVAMIVSGDPDVHVDMFVTAVILTAPGLALLLLAKLR